jgi:hypothetical protein
VADTKLHPQAALDAACCASVHRSEFGGDPRLLKAQRTGCNYETYKWHTDQLLHETAQERYLGSKSFHLLSKPLSKQNRITHAVSKNVDIATPSTVTEKASNPDEPSEIVPQYVLHKSVYNAFVKFMLRYRRPASSVAYAPGMKVLLYSNSSFGFGKSRQRDLHIDQTAQKLLNKKLSHEKIFDGPSTDGEPCSMTINMQFRPIHIGPAATDRDVISEENNVMQNTMST